MSSPAATARRSACTVRGRRVGVLRRRRDAHARGRLRARPADRSATPARRGRIATPTSSRSTRRRKRCSRWPARPARIRPSRRDRRLSAPARPARADLAAHRRRGARRSACIRSGCRSRSTTALTDGRTPCPACGTCDGFACAVQAKNDVSTILMPRLQRAASTLVTNTPAVRLEHAERPRHGGRLRRDGELGNASAIRGHGRRRRRRRARDAAPAAGLGIWRDVNPAATHRPLSDAPLQRGRHGTVPRRGRRRTASSTSRSAFTTTTSAIRRSTSPRGPARLPAAIRARPSPRSCASTCRSASARSSRRSCRAPPDSS